jgi:hypothetical protein
MDVSTVDPAVRLILGNRRACRVIPADQAAAIISRCKEIMAEAITADEVIDGWCGVFSEFEARYGER